MDNVFLLNINKSHENRKTDDVFLFVPPDFTVFGTQPEAHRSLLSTSIFKKKLQTRAPVVFFSKSTAVSGNLTWQDNSTFYFQQWINTHVALRLSVYSSRTTYVWFWCVILVVNVSVNHRYGPGWHLTYHVDIPGSGADFLISWWRMIVMLLQLTTLPGG